MSELDDGFIDVPLDSDDGFIDVPLKTTDLEPVKSVEKNSTDLLTSEELMDDFDPKSTLASQGLVNLIHDPINRLNVATSQAAQGASFGFSDEAIGGGKALYDVVTSEKTIDDLKALYEQYRDIERSRLQKQQEKYPILSAASQITGGIASSFIPVLGQLGNLPKGVGFVKAAGIGTGVGGLAGAGVSEANLLNPNKEELKELGTDVLKGGAIGGVITPTLGVLTPSILNTIKKSSLGQRFISGFRAGQPGRYSEKGYNFPDPESVQLISDDTLKAVEQTGEDVLDAFGFVNKNISEKMKKADESGFSIDVKEVLNDLKEEITAYTPHTRSQEAYKNEILDVIDRKLIGSIEQIDNKVIENIEVPATPSSYQKLEEELINKTEGLKEQARLSNTDLDVEYQINKIKGPDEKNRLMGSILIKRQPIIEYEHVPSTPGNKQKLIDMGVLKVEEMRTKGIDAVYTIKEVLSEDGRNVLKLVINKPDSKSGPFVKAEFEQPETSGYFNQKVKEFETKIPLPKVILDEPGIPAHFLTKERIDKQLIQKPDTILNAQKADEFRKSLSNLKYGEKYRSEPSLGELNRLLSKGVDDIRETVAGGIGTKSDLQSHHELQNTLKVLGIDPSDIRSISDENIRNQTMINKISSSFKDLQNDLLQGSKSRKKLENLKEGLKKAGFEDLANKIEERLSKQFELYDIAKGASGEGLGQLNLLGLSGAGVSTSAGSKIGQLFPYKGKGQIGGEFLAESIKSLSPKTIPKLTPLLETNIIKSDINKKNLYFESDENLLDLSDQISTIDSKVSELLKESVLSKDSDKKNRAIFIINQRPDLKKLYKEE